MDEQEYNDITLEQALDIVEQGEDVTDESLAKLRADDATCRCCAELLRLKAATRLVDEPVDVEAKLKGMKKRLNGDNGRKRTARVLAIITAMAAAIIVAVFIVNHPDANDPNVIFTAENANLPVTITDEEGDKTVLKANNTQAYNIAVSDYQRLMADESNIERLTVNVPDGKTAHVDLPDGSVALLHPGSKLTFPTAFVGGKRFVILEGEAYFKVKRNEAMPFIVQAEGVQTTVLGTEFNVKGSTVTLISGKVRLSDNADRHNTILAPGQQATLAANDRFSVANVDTIPYVYWRDGFLFYDNMTIRDIMRAIGRTYNMSVRCVDANVLDQRLRFMAERDKGVDAALQLMNSLGKVHVARKDSLILVGARDSSLQ